MKKIILSLFSAISLGILGNALWDKAFKPITEWAFNSLLYISTLGMEKYRNGIYVEIAKGLHESISLEILSWLVALFMGVVLTLVPFHLIVRRIRESNGELKAHTMFPFKVVNNIYFLILYLIFSLTFISLNFVQINYINRSVTYYNQLLVIVLPELTPNQERLFNSEFAQIKTRDDYIKITDKLKVLGEQTQKNLPKSPSFIF